MIKVGLWRHHLQQAWNFRNASMRGAIGICREFHPSLSWLSSGGSWDKGVPVLFMWSPPLLIQLSCQAQVLFVEELASTPPHSTRVENKTNGLNKMFSYWRFTHIFQLIENQVRCVLECNSENSFWKARLIRKYFATSSHFREILVLVVVVLLNSKIRTPKKKKRGKSWVGTASKLHTLFRARKGRTVFSMNRAKPIKLRCLRPWTISPMRSVIDGDSSRPTIRPPLFFIFNF